MTHSDNAIGTITKIGQFPSLADIYTGDIQKYQKLLGGEYSELVKAIGLYAHGIGIGSFVYLRRIFERLVEIAHGEAAKSVGWDETLYQRSRMADRIQLVKDHLPGFPAEHASTVLTGFVDKSQVRFSIKAAFTFVREST